MEMSVNFSRSSKIWNSITTKGKKEKAFRSNLKVKITLIKKSDWRKEMITIRNNNILRQFTYNLIK